MGKRSAVVELFLGDMGSMQRELRPSIQREDQPTMETKLGQIAVKAVNQLPKSVVREIRTPRSVGAGGGQLPPATRWARGNSRPYRESVPASTARPLYPQEQTSSGRPGRSENLHTTGRMHRSELECSAAAAWGHLENSGW
jgi:hypothetical protein